MPGLLEIPHRIVDDPKQTLNNERLKGWADGINDEATSLDARLDTAETDINAAEVDIASLEAADIALDTRLDALEAYEGYQVIGQPGKPAFQGTWANYDITSYRAASYWKDRNIVYMTGLVKGGAMPSVIFYLPSGYRPNLAEFHPVATNTGYGSLVVGADGAVTAISGGTGWFSLSGIVFRA